MARVTHNVKFQPRPGFIQTLAIIPSTYAIAAWVITLCLAPFAPLPISALSPTSEFVIAFTLFCFVASVAVQFSLAHQAVISADKPETDGVLLAIFLICSAIGMFGLAQYLSSIVPLVGGFDGLIYIIISQDFLVIRAISSEISTIGFQLSYLSWLSIYLGVFFVLRDRTFIYLKLPIAVMVVMQMAGNLLFIDRTRPMWIGVPILVVFWFAKRYYDVSIGRIIVYLSVFPVVLFFTFAMITGKYSQFGLLDNFFVYITGGYGYLNSIIIENAPATMIPVRSGYWLAKIIELFGYPIQIPDQVLPFRYVPFQTNVGTFVEPIFADGGLTFIFILLPIIIFGLDWLAIKMFRKCTYLSLFVWGNIVFFSMISFFVPKFNQLPIWLFLAIALMGDGARHIAARQKLATQ